MDNLIEPLIINMDTIRKNIEIPNIQYLTLLMFSLINETRGASYIISSIK